MHDLLMASKDVKTIIIVKSTTNTMPNILTLLNFGGLLSCLFHFSLDLNGYICTEKCIKSNKIR